MAFSMGRKAEINVTPMIDVLLVLLIIFMTIDLHTTGLDAQVPQPPDGATQPSSDIVVTVRTDDTVRLNQEPMAFSDLQARLASLDKNHPTRVLFVRAEGDPPFEQVARVIDVARGAGLERVALMPH